jgi:hypothetical protein
VSILVSLVLVEPKLRNFIFYSLLNYFQDLYRISDITTTDEIKYFGKNLTTNLFVDQSSKILGSPLGKSSSLLNDEADTEDLDENSDIEVNFFIAMLILKFFYKGRDCYCNRYVCLNHNLLKKLVNV